jgi:UDP-glucose 4-epimerase
MRALVTGGAGFIGSHLAEQLLREGWTVRVVDNLSTGRMENLAEAAQRLDFLRGDLLDEAVRERAVAGADAVFHLAAIPSVPRSVKDPLESHLHGAHATFLLLESARRAGVRRFIFAASCAAYGRSEAVPKTETMPADPVSPYAAGKAAGELYLRAFAACYSLDTVSLRYFNVFGPRQDPSSPYSGVLARFCRAFVHDEPLEIFGDGEQSRDFIYVADVVRATILAAAAPGRLGGEVLNVGRGEGVTINEAVRLLNELTGRQRRPKHSPARTGDVRHSVAEVGNARGRLGFQPAISFRDGLRKTLAWYRENQGKGQGLGARRPRRSGG